jgi:putative mycofactocin binding protein MftB
MAPCYTLAPGTQVREEDFGLLFYTQSGPRLYFLPCGDWLRETFFAGNQSLIQWLAAHSPHVAPEAPRVLSLEKALHELVQKGVLDEC